jgi:hypothetical protein
MLVGSTGCTGVNFGRKGRLVWKGVGTWMQGVSTLGIARRDKCRIPCCLSMLSRGDAGVSSKLVVESSMFPASESLPQRHEELVADKCNRYEP